MGSSDSSSSIIMGIRRYASYIENSHNEFLDLTHSKTLAVLEDSPYDGYISIDVNDAFFCIGYAISDFPSLYDMFGKFMAGFDVEILWDYVFEDSLNSPEIDNTISSEMKLVDDNIINSTLPEFQIAMRNINSVISSSFVIGKSVIENGRVKMLSKISSEARFQMIPDAQARLNTSLSWDKKIVTLYAETMKLYYTTKMGVDSINYKFDAQDKLWPFTVLDFERAALGALRGTSTFQKLQEKRERSMVSKVLTVLQWTVNGLLLGAEIGGIYGAIIGAIIGFIVGLAIVLLE